MSSVAQPIEKFIASIRTSLASPQSPIRSKKLLILLSLSSASIFTFLYQFRKNYLKKKRLNEQNLATMEQSYDKMMKKKRKHLNKKKKRKITYYLATNLDKNCFPNPSLYSKTI